MLDVRGDKMFEDVTVKAIRTDSWLGIEKGEFYSALKVEGGKGKIRVSTNGYYVIFNEKDFVIVSQ
jgi:hypothetical protein